MTPAVKSPIPYAIATAASLYVPGHPTEAWREACRAAERAWVAIKKPNTKGAK